MEDLVIEGKYAASNFFVKQGIVLDLLRNCYTRTYKIINLFTFKDKCASIPKPDYILLFRTLYAKCEPCSPEDFDDSSLVQLSIVYKKNRRLIVHETKSYSESVALAKKLATTYRLKVRDSASDRRKPVWLTE